MKTIKFPNGTSPTLIQSVADALGSWFITMKLTVVDTTITWDQATYYGRAAEGISAYTEGLLLGFNACSKAPAIYTYEA